MEKTIDDYFQETVDNMTNLRTYKPEFDECIGVYATLLYQYNLQYARLAESGFNAEIQCTNSKGEQTAKANPLIKILESLRRDIKIYTDALSLNPRANNSQPEPPTGKPNKLAMAPVIPLRA